MPQGCGRDDPWLTELRDGSAEGAAGCSEANASARSVRNTGRRREAVEELRKMEERSVATRQQDGRYGVEELSDVDSKA
eukprot:6195495-Pleurochrysis_carterae.AAC.3